MQHLGTQPITTQRLFLRKFRHSDADAMFSGWAGIPQATRYVSWGTHRTPDETAAIIDSWIAEYPKLHFYEWAITDLATGKLIGSIGAAAQPDSTACEVGYCLAPEYWNQGLATEACRAVIQYLWNCGFESIDALHDLRNPASGRVMQKSGMHYQGKRMVTLMKNGQTVPCCHYIIRKEGVPY